VIENLPVPRLPAFYGIVIYMYRPDHSTAALHAQYGEHIAQIELGSLKILNDSCPAGRCASFGSGHACTLTSSSAIESLPRRLSLA